MGYCTKDNPGCYHSMIKYLAFINGQSETVEDKIMTLRELYWKPDAPKAKNRHLKYKSYNIHVIDEFGKSHPFIANGLRYDKFIGPIIPSHFICTRLRRIEEFDKKPVKIGKYNDSLPGGWYQKVDLYQIDDKFFAEIDCVC